MNTPVYELELNRWGVFNDGTHSLETTNGINEALMWAKNNGYKTFKIPDGVYLIAKGTKPADPVARINMVGDMDLLLSKNTILQKETNEFEIYNVLYVGRDVKNVTIQGGTFRGDRDTHDYSKKGPDTAGTHEWGYGIEVVGAENIVVDSVKLERFTGDGIIVSGTTITGTTITEADLEIGAINDIGQPVAAVGKVRTNNRNVTNFSNSVYQTYRNIYFWLPQGITPGSTVDVYYYRKDGSFIKADKQIQYYSGESIIPNDADYFRAVFDAPSTKGVKVSRMTVDISTNVTIRNCDIGYNRRQGISLVGSDGVEIVNNHIHHTNGTAPQSGIDIEPGFYPGRNTLIKGNKFTENKIQIVLAFGENVAIEENVFNQTISDSIGIHAHQDFRGNISIKKNIFNGSSLTVKSNNAVIQQNTFQNAEVSIQGVNNIFSHANMVDVRLSVGSGENQRFENLIIQHNGIYPNILSFGDKPIYLQNIYINAKTNGKGIITGIGNNNSIYEYITIVDVDRKGTTLPTGTYTNCYFDLGMLTINRIGSYTLNNCTIKNNSNLFSVINTYGMPTITINESILELTGNVGYGAAIYILGAENFQLVNSTILAKNNTINTPLLKIGPSGSPLPTKILAASIIGNMFVTKTAISGIHTTNAGTDAPPYLIEGNALYNALLNLKSNDININNTLMTL